MLGSPESFGDAIKKYTGTLIVVSHDRQFLDATVDTILVFEADGKIHHYKGGYSQWQSHNKALAITDTPVSIKNKSNRALHQSKSDESTTTTTARPKKVSYKIPSVFCKTSLKAFTIFREINGLNIFFRQHEIKNTFCGYI